MPLAYHEQEDRRIHVRMKEMLERLPRFSSLFFRGIEPRTQSRTRLAYAYDMTVFFQMSTLNIRIMRLCISTGARSRGPSSHMTCMWERRKYLQAKSEPRLK